MQTLHLSFFAMVAASGERFALPALRLRPLHIQLIAQEVCAGLEVMYHYCSVSFSAECSRQLTANGGHRFAWEIFQAVCPNAHNQYVVCVVGWVNVYNRRVIVYFLIGSEFCFRHLLIDMSKQLCRVFVNVIAGKCHFATKKGSC